MGPPPLCIRLFISLVFSLFLTRSEARCSLNPSIYDFQIGKVRGTIVSDGIGIFDTNPYLIPDEVVVKSYRKCFRHAFPITVQQNIPVLDVNGRRIIVDTGSTNIPEFPTFNNAGKLLTNLKAAGIPPSSIDAVILTHGHVDHVSGLVTPSGKAAFPNADVYIGKDDHDFWVASNISIANPNISDELYGALSRIYKRSIRPYNKRLHLVRKNGSLMKGVKFVHTPGHSPGHNAVQISSEGEELLIIGDNWGGKANQLRNPEWKFFVETNHTDALESRLRIMRMAARRRSLVLAYHEDFPGLGNISRRRRKFDWIPVPLQRMGAGVSKQC